LQPKLRFGTPSCDMILIGTSGFSYDDWIGPFYPKTLTKQDFLTFYSQHFRACELNFSYYRVPTAKSLEQMAEKSGGRVEFAVKANQEMTHVREDNAKVFEAFNYALVPLIDRKLLGCVLAQFPYSFHNTQENRAYLKRFKEQMGEILVVVEFRNRKWINEAMFKLLRELDCGFCCVDEPPLKGLLPPVAVATSDIGYVRFHGRNREKWWEHDDPAERYDYLYSEGELQEWLPKIQVLERSTKKVYIFTNNHRKGKAVQNAKQLSLMLDLIDSGRTVNSLIE
jgi:uncharacterized protein YecE (DUF72 family)